MRIAIGSDHAAPEERSAIIEVLRGQGHEVVDVGCPPGASVDYPEPAADVARRVASGEVDRGILICGTGIGVAMAAGKIDGVRAATIGDAFSAEMTRRHNDANVACFGARILSTAAMLRLIDLFLETPFDGGRHERRRDKIMALEKGASVPS